MTGRAEARAARRQAAKRAELLLGALGPVVARPMFGGHGVFLDGLMFALVAQSGLYFKADDDARAFFAAAGGAPFLYNRQGREIALSYWAPPKTLEDDAETLLAWGTRALAAARRVKGRANRKKKR